MHSTNCHDGSHAFAYPSVSQASSPWSIRYIMQPRLKISKAYVCGLKSTTSVARNPSVPTLPPVVLVELNLSAKPKSSMRTRIPGAKRMFSGLRSQRIKPRSCKWINHLGNSAPKYRLSSSVMAPQLLRRVYKFYVIPKEGKRRQRVSDTTFTNSTFL